MASSSGWQEGDYLCFNREHEPKQPLTVEDDEADDEALAVENDVELQRAIVFDIKVPQALNHARVLFNITILMTKTLQGLKSQYRLETRQRGEKSKLVKSLVGLLQHNVKREAIENAFPKKDVVCRTNGDVAAVD